MPKHRITIADILLIAGLLAISLLLLLPRPSHTTDAAVTVTWENGTETFPLTETRTLPLTSNGITLTVIAENGSVRVADSSCPDHVCTKTGAIRTHGDAIVCLPAKVSVTIHAHTVGNEKEDSDEDFIVG